MIKLWVDVTNRGRTKNKDCIEGRRRDDKRLKGCIDYKAKGEGMGGGEGKQARLHRGWGKRWRTAHFNNKQLQSNLKTCNNTNTHRKPRAQVFRAFRADVVVPEVDACQRIVLLYTKHEPTTL